MRAALEYINNHPRIILLMSWPVLSALLLFLILIIWKGPWLALAAVQLKQLDLLGWIAGGITTVLALNQIAQSSTFFGKLGFKVGSFVDVSADMDKGQEGKETTAPPTKAPTHV